MLRPGAYIRRLVNKIRENPKVFALYSVLRILVIISLINTLIKREYESTMVCVLVLILFLIPSFMEEQLHMEIPPLFEAIIYVFIFAAQILGEVNNFYTSIPGWDTVLHTINGFLAAAVGFSMIYILNRHSKNISLSPFYLAMVAFCFSLTVGIMWEFVETVGDLFFGQDMQKDYIISSITSVTLDPTHSQKLVTVKDITKTVIYTASGETVVIEGGYLDVGRLDTMKDLFVNFIGALAFSVIGYIYMKMGGHLKGRPLEHILAGLMLRPKTETESAAGTQETQDEGFEVSRLVQVQTDAEIERDLKMKSKVISQQVKKDLEEGKNKDHAAAADTADMQQIHAGEEEDEHEGM